MFLAIVLNLASIIVVVGGWAIAVRTLYKGLGADGAPAARLDAPRLPRPDRLPDVVLPVKRAA